MHIGLDPIAGKPADFIGRCIPSLKRWKGEMDREVTGSHPACVYPSFTQQPLCLAISLSMTWNEPERGQPVSTSGHTTSPEGPGQPQKPPETSPCPEQTSFARVQWEYDSIPKATYTLTFRSFPVIAMAPAYTSHQFCSASALVSSTMSPGLRRRKGPMAPGGGGSP